MPGFTLSYTYAFAKTHPGIFSPLKHFIEAMILFADREGPD